ncbi:ribosome silencing factor [Weissella soli]|jgi:ribosome-associated protein|uniref:Ribosomal silencing factor RsfS n=1 Tax=Weissella soli TaxID=155866 RepID=A0A288QC22_9LACO|nr:ribosome silencing factor [Weissella soli]AOT56832.1 Ribosomal silencing factor RsfS [Weissella soli]NKY83283.1 ribosome silencing factor [Weissella soli]QEA34270.1 ribosome silencing factor [Weissella soli]RDL05425.1 ribosome-associated protein [Weissella soli]GEN93534.1 ribosomal silencing factor RsfS [Weissella soli]
MSLENMLEVAVKAADQKRAEDIVALDIHEISLLADAFVILDAPTNRQVVAIADEIEDKMAEAGYPLIKHEGRREGEWVLMNFGDVIVHIFKKDTRSFYNLEKLWGAEGKDIDIENWIVKEEF